MCLDWNNPLSGVSLGLLACSTEHQGDGWAVKVTIAETDLQSLLCEGYGEVGRDGGLPDSTFTRGHCDDFPDPGDGLLASNPSRRVRRSRGILHINGYVNLFRSSGKLVECLMAVLKYCLLYTSDAADE